MRKFSRKMLLCIIFFMLSSKAFALSYVSQYDSLLPSVNCGPSSLAMITGKTTDQMRASIGTAGPVTVMDMTSVLRFNGIKFNVSYRIEYIIDNVLKGNHTIVLLDADFIHEAYGMNSGHYVVLESYLPEEDKFIVYDPAIGIYKVKSGHIQGAMRAWDGTGIICYN